MNQTELEKFIRSNAPYKDIKVSGRSSYNTNVLMIKEQAFTEYACKFLYKHLNNLYGDECAERLIVNLLNKTMQITNVEHFAFKQFPYVRNVVFLDELKKGAVVNGNASDLYNFLNILGDIMFIINNNVRNSEHVLLVDLLIFLSMFFDNSFKKKIVSNAYFEKRRYLAMYLRQLTLVLVKSLCSYGEYGCNIEIGVLDRTAYKKLTKERDYSFRLKDFDPRSDEKKKIQVSPSYRKYVQYCKMFLKFLKGYMLRMDVTPPQIRYIKSYNQNHAQILQDTLKEFLGIPDAVINTRLTRVYIGKEINLDEEPYVSLVNGFNKDCRNRFSVEEIKKVIRDVVDTELSAFNVNAGNSEDLLIRDCLKYNVKYNKTPLLFYDFRGIDNLFSPAVSEVVIDYNKIYDDLLSIEGLMQKVSEFYVDGQAINQARLNLFDNLDVTKAKLNVRFVNVEERYLPQVYNTLYEQTKFLKSVYGLNFTYDIALETFKQ